MARNVKVIRTKYNQKAFTPIPSDRCMAEAIWLATSKTWINNLKPGWKATAQSRTYRPGEEVIPTGVVSLNSPYRWYFIGSAWKGSSSAIVLFRNDNQIVIVGNVRREDHRQPLTRDHLVEIILDIADMLDLPRPSETLLTGLQSPTNLSKYPKTALLNFANALEKHIASGDSKAALQAMSNLYWSIQGFSPSAELDDFFHKAEHRLKYWATP